MSDEKVFDVREFLKKKGYHTIDSSWDSRVADWRAWFSGKLKSFHDYRVYNGNTMIEKQRFSLQMAKKACEDRADLLLNEKVRITVPEEKAQEYLDRVFDDNNFWVRGNQMIELTAALGTGAFIEYTDAGGIPRIDYIICDCIFPLEWRKRGIIDCAFASEKYIEGKKTYYISINKLESDGYTIENYIVGEDGSELTLPDNILPVVKTYSFDPPFQIVTLNICNNIDTSSPMGISLFANSIDTMKAIDLIYDSYQNEFRLGKKRIMLRDSMLKMTSVATSDGISTDIVPVFDPNDTEFYSYNGFAEDGDGIKEIDMTLRSSDHEIALQSNLDLFSEKCGFGKGYYKLEADGVQTATGVVSQNSQLYRKIKKDEIILEYVLECLTKNLLRLGGYKDDMEISISFDDSIIEDTSAIANRKLLEFNAGIIDEVQYFIDVDGLEKDAALKKLEEIQKRKPKEQSINFFDQNGDQNPDQNIDDQQQAKTQDAEQTQQTPK